MYTSTIQPGVRDTVKKQQGNVSRSRHRSGLERNVPVGPSLSDRHQQLQHYIESFTHRSRDIGTRSTDSIVTSTNTNTLPPDRHYQYDFNKEECTEDERAGDVGKNGTNTSGPTNTGLMKISYTGELNDDGIMHGAGVLIYSSGIRYEGDFYYGKRHGYGKLIYPLASVIPPASRPNASTSTNTSELQNTNQNHNDSSCIIVEGHFENDQLVGDARILYPDNEEYVGTVVDGKSHGKGVYRYNNKDVYDGDWVNGLRHGCGTMIFSLQNGTVQEMYQGEWKDDEMDGNGVYKHADGSIYEGSWSHSKMHGYGVLYYANGNIYRGDFYRDLKHGKGELIYAEGGKYIGDWVDDVAHGYGCVEYEGGEVYVGEFSYGFKCGSGKLTLPNNDVLYGTWKDDQLVGTAKMVYHETGNVYLGEFQGAIRSGYGQLLETSTNTIYEGEWANNTRHGEGKIVFPDQSYAIGQWSHGKPLDLKYILPDNSPWLDHIT